MSIKVKANGTTRVIDEYRTLAEGSANGNVTLNDNASNYKYIDIMYAVDNLYKTVRVYAPNSKSAVLDIFDFDNAIIMYTKTITISGTSVVVNRYKKYTIKDSTSWIPYGASSNDIYIKKIVGYY